MDGCLATLRGIAGSIRARTWREASIERCEGYYIWAPDAVEYSEDVTCESGGGPSHAVLCRHGREPFLGMRGHFLRFDSAALTELARRQCDGEGRRVVEPSRVFAIEPAQTSGEVLFGAESEGSGACKDGRRRWGRDWAMSHASWSGRAGQGGG